MEVCINNMVVKSKKPEEYIPNLAEVFKILRHHKLRLNTTKCAFRVGSSRAILRKCKSSRG